MFQLPEKKPLETELLREQTVALGRDLRKGSHTQVATAKVAADSRAEVRGRKN